MGKRHYLRVCQEDKFGRKGILDYICGMKALLFSLALCFGLPAWAFSSKDVSVHNVSDNVVLAGTITLPDDGEPRAAIVMATGSGAQDRDEAVAGHKPFKAIAEYLSGRGYAVLRMDDRGVGGSTGARENVTTSSNVRDVEAGLAWLDSAYNDVPAGVIGHSEGGIIALRTAAENPKCRFIVTLAGPAWKGDSLIMAQSRALAMAVMGKWDGEAQQRALLAIAESDRPEFLAAPMMSYEIAKALGDAALLPQGKEYIAKSVEGMLSPWYREFLRYDPAEDVRRVRVPWLALNGDKDLQVPVENLTTIRELNPAADAKVMEGHNHLFQHASTGLPTEYASLPEDISDETLAAIAAWLDGSR